MRNEKQKFLSEKVSYLIPALVDIKSVSSTPLSKDTASYTCTAEQEIKFNKIDGAKDQYEMKMSISNVQIQAFGVNKDFSPGWFNIRHL